MHILAKKKFGVTWTLQNGAITSNVSAPPSVSIQTANFLFLCASPLFAHPHSSFMLPAQALCFATKEVPAQQTLKLLTLLQRRSLHSKCSGSHKSTSNAHLSPSKLILCSTFNYRAPFRFLPIYTLSNNLCPYQNAVLWQQQTNCLHLELSHATNMCGIQRS
jgi:hypothetical protein